TAADDRTAAGASTKFRESHSYRHDTHPVFGAGVGSCGSAQIIIRQPWLFTTDAKDDGGRKAVNHDVAVNGLLSASLGFFRPIRGHDPERGERRYDISSSPRLVNGGAAIGSPLDSASDSFFRRGAPAHAGAARQKCHGATTKREAFSIGF
ncbi:MAG TPA: hypothetical protein VF637_05240, partial [Sphingomicrobium sp.]